MQNVAVHIRESKVAAGVTEGELLMIEAQTVQHGGMQVVHTDRGIGRAEAQFVSRSVHCSTTNTATCQPDSETPMIMIATGLRPAVSTQLDRGGPAELAAPEYQRVLEQTALFQVRDERSNGLINLSSQAAMGGFDV